MIHPPSWIVHARLRCRAVIVQSRHGFLPLAGEAPVGRQAGPSQSGPRHAIGIVAGVAIRDFSPAGVHGQAGRAERVAVKVGQHAALPLGDALGAEVSILAPLDLVARPLWQFVIFGFLINLQHNPTY